MKFNIRNITPILCLISSQFVLNNAQTTEPSLSPDATKPVNGTTLSSDATKPVNGTTPSPVVVSEGMSQGKIVTITEEQLDEFQFGSEQFRLAIIGDSGAEKDAKKVMELSTFDALLHLGDYDYSCKPNMYFDNIIAGRKFQFMGILGNHEGVSQCKSQSITDQYTNNIYSEMTDKTKNGDVSCVFSESKLMWACTYKNVKIIGLTPAINGADDRGKQLSFLKEHLSSSNEDWKICSWHFYDKYYHTGRYPEDSRYNTVSKDGESFYDVCKDHGAIIFSAHDHVYARTKLMSKFSSPEIDIYDGVEEGKIVQIRPGATFNILNGAGGWEMYIENGKEKDYSHWQKKYAKGSSGENEKRYGGLFCDFNYKGDNRKTHCRFLRINSSEKVFDSFYIYKNENPGNVTYIQMDEEYKNEKLNAYKLAHQITDKVNFVSNGKDDDKEKGDGEGKNNFENLGLPAQKIIIGGSICAAALVVIGGGLFMFKKNRKVKFNDKDFTEKKIEKNHNDVYDLYNNGNGNNNNNNNNNHNNNNNNYNNYNNNNYNNNKFNAGYTSTISKNYTNNNNAYDDNYGDYKSNYTSTSNRHQDNFNVKGPRKPNSPFGNGNTDPLNLNRDDVPLMDHQQLQQLQQLQYSSNYNKSNYYSQKFLNEIYEENNAQKYNMNNYNSQYSSRGNSFNNNYQMY